MTAVITRRRLTADEYHRMGEVGILHEDEHIELIEGELIEMSSIGIRHMVYVARLTRWFHRHGGDRALVWVQNAIRLTRYTEPEPDVVLLRPRPDDYLSAFPGPDDVMLLIEVADSSLAYDREVKLSLYAAAGIVEVWIVDVQNSQVIVCRHPSAGYYREATTHGAGSVLSSLALPDLAITWQDIFGAP